MQLLLSPEVRIPAKGAQVTPEGKVKAEIKKVLEAAGAWYFMPSMNGYGRKGIPDFIGCVNGRFFAIEAKAENGKATPWQERELAAIAKSGGMAMIAKSGDDVREFLKDF